MAIKHDSGLSTRDEILRLTVEAIDLGGEGGVHVAEIAKASHVAVTSIYHFFQNREGLIEAAQASRFAREFTINANAFSEEVNKCVTQEEFRALLRPPLNFPSHYISHRAMDGFAKTSTSRIWRLGISPPLLLTQ